MPDCRVPAAFGAFDFGRGALIENTTK
ncbi:hypothetical protein LCGC14_1689290, partial [marine sediment metagenome]